MPKVSIETTRMEITSANMLAVTVGSNCPQGGDTGHGGRTYLALEDLGGTDMRVIVDGKRIDEPNKVELIFGGDTEHDTLIRALKFALDTLQDRALVTTKAGPTIKID